MSPPALTALGVERVYGSMAERVVALQAVDFSITGGEFTMIGGPSGSGKSTLLAILAGLLQPTAGQVRVLGRDLTDFRGQELARFRLDHFGFIFQGFHLLPYLNALEQVSMLLERQGATRLVAAQRARAALESVGVGHRLNSRPAEMSGGEKQRVAIARALAKRPQVIFADEPTSALDSANGVRVADLLRAAALDDGVAVICVSHDPRLAHHATRVLQMEDGRFVAG